MVFQMRILNVHIFFSRNRKVLVNGSLYRITFSIVIFTNTETTLDEQKLKELSLGKCTTVAITP